MKNLKLIGIIFFIIAAMSSCSVKDNPNELLNTQFKAEVMDSSHVLSPKTYSYLYNIKPPLGIKPVVVAVENIEDEEMGRFADDLFDQFCEEKYSGHTFSKRGILIVASKNPELVQVRVGSTYAIYCRMRGSAAGADYLEMQKATAQRGIDEMCPVALKNVIGDIESARELPWFKKLALKLSFVNVDMLMEDLGTPSESFFSQFYFQPFLYVVGFLKSILGSWVLSFILISLVYLLTTRWLKRKMDAFCVRLIGEDTSSRAIANSLSSLIVFLVKLIITIPTFTAIAVLSTSRTEDIIALRHANIPSVDMLENVSIWTNTSTSLWIVLLLVVVYYLKYILCDKGLFTIGQISDNVQVAFYNKEKELQSYYDACAQNGHSRKMINILFQMAFGVFANAIQNHNFQEVDTVQPDSEPNETNTDDKRQKRLIDFMFHGTDSAIYKQSPFFALLVNLHREALFLAAPIGLIALILLSRTYSLYFLVLWSVHIVMRIKDEYDVYRSIPKQMKATVDPLRLFKHVWKTIVIYLISLAVIFFVLTPSYEEKSMEGIAEVQMSLPEDFSGRYFVPKAEGQDVKGVTAKLTTLDKENYILDIFSDKPIRRFALVLDKNAGLFHCDILGDGYISYDEQTKTIKINFSDLWILTN